MNNDFRCDLVADYLLTVPAISAIVDGRIYVDGPDRLNEDGIYITLNRVSGNNDGYYRRARVEFLFQPHNNNVTRKELEDLRTLMTDTIVTADSEHDVCEKSDFLGFVCERVLEGDIDTFVDSARNREVLLKDYVFYYTKFTS